MAATAFANQISYRRAQAGACEGGSLKEFGDVVVSALTSGVDVTVSDRSAPEDLERALVFALELGRERGGSLGCWAVDDPPPRWVTAAAVSNGLQWGWTARWMVNRVTLQDGPPSLPCIRIERLDSVPAERAQVPFVDENWEALLPIDRTTTVLGAFDEDTLVGTVAIHVNPASSNAAIFNLGVAHDYQRRGIGKALLQHALAEGTRQGAMDVTLNATDAGAPLYAAVGFEDVGRGQTWWITPEMWAKPRPTEHQRQVAHAIAMNLPDIPATDNDVLPCNLRPMRLAATTHSPVAAHALQGQGIRLDALSAWDLGWKAEARDAARGSIDAVDDDEKATLLHTAIQRDDRELAQMCLDLGARTDIKDPVYGSDALGWCAACQRPEIRGMIEQRGILHA